MEGSEACQGELAVEDGSSDDGIIDADGAQSHGDVRLSDAQGVQIVGAEHDTAENMGEGSVGVG